jgi:hypothetical protein
MDFENKKIALGLNWLCLKATDGHIHCNRPSLFQKVTRYATMEPSSCFLNQKQVISTFMLGY